MCNADPALNIIRFKIRILTQETLKKKKEEEQYGAKQIRIGTGTNIKNKANPDENEISNR